MTQTQEQIEKLRTLQETSDFWADVAENQLPALADKIDNIDLTPIENKVDEGVSTLSAKIDNIKLPEIDTTELAKESTLNTVSSKLDNLNVEVDLSSVAKQGSNADATNSAILEGIERILARSARYDSATGNLQFDNIDLTIV